MKTHSGKILVGRTRGLKFTASPRIHQPAFTRTATRGVAAGGPDPRGGHPRCDLVQRADEPREAIGQGPVEIEDDQPIVAPC